MKLKLLLTKWTSRLEESALSLRQQLDRSVELTAHEQAESIVRSMADALKAAANRMTMLMRALPLGEYRILHSNAAPFRVVAGREEQEFTRRL